MRFLKILKHCHILNRDHDVFIAAYIEGMDKESRKHGYNLEITHICFRSSATSRPATTAAVARKGDRG